MICFSVLSSLLFDGNNSIKMGYLEHAFIALLYYKGVKEQVLIQNHALSWHAHASPQGYIL